MANRKDATQIPIPRTRSVPGSYREGAVPISIPRNPSTPLAKTSRGGHYRQLFTGPPVDPVREDNAEAPTPAKGLCRTPSSTSKTTSKSASKPTSQPISIPLSTLPQGPHLHDPAESFAATHLESLIPIPFIAFASDARHNVILPPKAPKPNPTRYTILFDAAHALIMHQSVVSSTVDTSGAKVQLEELTRISYRQAKFIVQLEEENRKLRKLVVEARLGTPDATLRPTAPITANTTPTPAPTKQHKKRKRNETKKEKQEPLAYGDGLGNKVEADEQEKQREEREKKLLKLLKRQESLMEESDDDE